MKRFPTVSRVAFDQQRSLQENPPSASASKPPTASTHLGPEAAPDRRFHVHAALHDADCSDPQYPWVSRVHPLCADYVAIDLDPVTAPPSPPSSKSRAWSHELASMKGAVCAEDLGVPRAAHLIPLAPALPTSPHAVLPVVATVWPQHPKMRDRRTYRPRPPQGTVDVDYLQNIPARHRDRLHRRASDYAACYPLEWKIFETSTLATSRSNRTARFRSWRFGQAPESSPQTSRGCFKNPLTPVRERAGVPSGIGKEMEKSGLARPMRVAARLEVLVLFHFPFTLFHRELLFSAAPKRASDCARDPPRLYR